MRLFKRRGAQPEPAETPTEVIAEAKLPTPPAVDAKGRRAVAAQREYLLNLVSPLPAFGMYLLDAWGTAVCEDIVADSQLPVDDLAAVAGYAVRAEDLAALPVRGTATLQLRDETRISKADIAIHVNAGQTLPAGADAVIPADHASLDGSKLIVNRPVTTGDYVRWTGSDVRPGVPILRSGERLDARRSALLALAGIDRVLARPRPRVVVLSVADASSDPTDVESHLLAAAAKADGAQVWRVAVSTGTDRELRDAISDQLIRADLVVASGVLDAAGQLPRVVAEMGLSDLADVALQPGGRIGFALVGEDEIPMVLLPDDPVEAYVGYQGFVRPLIRKLMGAPVVHRATVECLSGGDLPGGSGMTQIRFGTVREQSGEQVVVPLGRADNPRFADLVSADALIVIGPDAAPAHLGDRVACWLLDD